MHGIKSLLNSPDKQPNRVGGVVVVIVVVLVLDDILYLEGTLSA